MPSKAAVEFASRPEASTVPRLPFRLIDPKQQMTLWRAIHESERYLLGHLSVHANIDRCLELLDDHDLSSERRSAISTALVDEINRLSHRLEQLEFIESRTAACRERLKQLRSLRSCFQKGARVRVQAEMMIENFQSIVSQAEKICSFMRRRMREDQLSALRPPKHSKLYRGISCSMQSCEPDGWIWEFRLGERLKRGRTRTKLQSLAERRVKMLIDRELRMASRNSRK
jgi:hypothetical protein